MRLGTFVVILAGLLMAGCNSQGGGGSGGGAPQSSAAPGDPGGMPGVALTPGGVSDKLPGDAPEAATAESKPVPIEAGAATLTPGNTKIVFVGTHVGAKPDPRTGGFEKFTGKAEVDPDTKTLKSVSVDIETPSVWTQIPNLTNHLKTADFFDVREHPQAAFQSTSIKADDAAAAGSVTITGNLTLHGVTKEISFPAGVRINEEGLTLTSKLTIDRTEFGMTFGPDRVEKAVSLTVVIGEKTEVTQGAGFGPGGPGRGTGRRPGGQGGRPEQPPAAQPADGQDK